MQPRRALLLASLSRYVTLVLQAVSMLTVAHHVPPDQFGLTVLGTGVLALAGAVRELGSTSYLVQQRELTGAQIGSAGTIAVLITLGVAAVIAAGAGPIAAFYRDERLVWFLRLMVIGFTLEAFFNPISALLAREMAFGRLALLEIVPTALGAGAAVLLVRDGVGYIAVAWAAVVQAVAATILAFCVQPDLRLFRPGLRDWRSILAFGLHGSATAIVYRLGETLAFLLLGRVLDTRAVALIQRSYLISQIPERVVLAGVGAVALPVFSRLIREDKALAPAYLYSIHLLGPVYLASVLALVPLARAAVLVLLGPAWIDAIPLVQIMAAGHLVGIASSLNIMVLIGSGQIRASTPLAGIQIAVLLVAVLVAAPHGLVAVAWTSFVTVPVNTAVSFWFVQRHVAFDWRALFAALRPGVVVALCSAAGAAVVPWLTDWPDTHPVLALVSGVALGGAAWLVALRLVRHKLHDELAATVAAALRRLRRGTLADRARSPDRR